MRRILTTLLAALLVLPATGAQTDPTELAVGEAVLSIVDPNPTAPRNPNDDAPEPDDVSRADASAVDLVADHQLRLHIEVPVEDDKDALAVTAHLFLADETQSRIQLALQKDEEIDGHDGEHPSDDNLIDGCQPAKFCLWSGDVSIDNPKLVAGEWTVRVAALDEDGNEVITAEADEVTFDVDVASDSEHALTLSLLSAPCNADQEEGFIPLNVTAGKTLQAGPVVAGAQYLLARVSYSVSHEFDTEESTADDHFSIEETTLVSPYLVSGSVFKDGPQTMHLTASDRAGRTVTCDIDLLVDTKAPVAIAALTAGVVDPLGPRPIAYQGVPFNLTAVITESSDYVVRAVVGQELQVQDQDNGTVPEASPGIASHTFTFNRTALGFTPVFLSVVDAFDNRASILLNVTVVEAITDSSVTLARDDAVPLAGDSVSVQATAHQNGVKPLTFLVRYDARHGQSDHFVNITTDGSTEVDPYSGVYPIGTHEVTATIFAPQGINETDSSNQQANLTFEVFIAELVYNGTSHYVRGDLRRMPCHLVEDPSEVSGGPCDLKRIEVNLTATHYVFQALGHNVTWDPADLEEGARPVYDLGSPPVAEDKKEKKSPGPWLGLLLAMLVAIAARRRQT